MQCNENEKWEKFRPFPLFDGPKKDLGIWFPDIHSKSAGCIEKGVFSKAELLLLKLIHLFTRDALIMKKSEIEKTKTA